MIDRQAIQQRWDDLCDTLDERGRRLFAAAEVRAAGYGGLTVVAEVTGLARSTINRGEDDLDAGAFPKERVRRKGGGAGRCVRPTPLWSTRFELVSSQRRWAIRCGR